MSTGMICLKNGLKLHVWSLAGAVAAQNVWN